MRVIWTPEALQDRSEIWVIQPEKAQAALRMDELFSAAAARLAALPMLGHPGEIPDTRELSLHPNYRLVYEIPDEIVWILALVHAARRWPPMR